jgi:hypothetical protein
MKESVIQEGLESDIFYIGREGLAGIRSGVKGRG